MKRTSIVVDRDLVGEALESESPLPTFRSYYAGSWRPGPEAFEVRSPIDLGAVARAYRTPKSDVEAILSDIYNVGRWEARDMPGDRRLEVLQGTADIMEEHIDAFIDALVINAGKTRQAAEGEVRGSIERLRKAAYDLRKIVGDHIPGDWTSEAFETEAIIRREPYGVVAAIVPFNYPLLDVVNKFTYSFLPGNAVIIKPPESVPLPAIYFVSALLRAGLPRHAVALVLMSGRDVSETNMLADPRISVISLTGSTPTGLAVMRQAGIKQYIMELGGGDPAIVMRDADLADTAKKIRVSITSYSGQRCDAIRLIIAERPIYEQLRELLVKEFSSVKVGDPREEGVDMGPIIDVKTADYMLQAVREAEQAGCRILYGGRRLEGMGPNYVEPTLIECTDWEKLRGLTLYREEVFAPVTLLTPFDDDDEAIELANGRRYGLDAAVFGRDPARIRKFVRLLEVGAIYVNDYPKHGISYYPFGGRKDSGIGREGIGYSVEQTTALKSIVYSYRGQGVWDYI